jgi:hypothetical protein
MHLDFSDPDRREALKRAAELITEAYRILSEEVGSSNPSDNAFLREAMVCAECSLIWQSHRGGIDAIDPRTDDEVEIKSTKIDGKAHKFPTSRAISPTVIKRFREAGYWLFAIFDGYSNLAVIYRVEQDDMESKIDTLEAKMRLRAAKGEPLENNPKTTLDSIRASARVVFMSQDFVETEISAGRWRVTAK